MAADEIRKYINDALTIGKNTEEIVRDLLVSGWKESDVRAILKEFQGHERKAHSQTRNQSWLGRHVVNIVLAIAVIFFGSTSFYLWQNQLDLSEKNSERVREFYSQLAESRIAFTDAGEMVFPDEQRFLSKKSEYIETKTSFIEADLRAMRLTLYENGIASTTLDILTKGKEKSWWETPTGDYKVLGKSSNAFSSIGHVWMPYSIQFYGNYFIHGWPYYDDGTPVASSYSGGCIRLATSDAKIVFEFSKTGMPLLVLEDEDEHAFGSLSRQTEEMAPPAVSAESFLLADIASGEVILEKSPEEVLPIASLAKLMTAVVAHEVIYLGRPIKVRADMLASIAAVFQPVEGERYTGLDLLYPLLMQSSNETAAILAGFLGEKVFVKDMNIKALSLGMSDTRFADASGISAENISTAKDLARLLQYIYFKRFFIYDISKGVAFENVGIIQLGNTIPIAELKNINEFVDAPDLIGIKNGDATDSGQTMASVWKLHTDEGDIPVAIVVLGSQDSKHDTEVLLEWLKANYARP